MKSQNKQNHVKTPPLYSGDNHNYINLNQTHNGPRLPSYSESSIYSDHSFNKRSTLPAVKIEEPQGNHDRGLPNQSNPSLPQYWHSPPSSVNSFSKPPSLAHQNVVLFKNPSKANSIASRQLSIASSVIPKTQFQLQTIDEDNVEVPVDKLLKLCGHSNEDLKVNALGYLQHITFNNPDIKMQVRDYNGLPTIIMHIEFENNYVARAALGVLKNLSFTDLETITTDIERLGGIQKLVNIIYSTDDFTQKELAIDTLWNLSVKYNLKPLILTDVIPILLNSVIIPDSGMLRQDAGNYINCEEDIVWSTMLRNSLGIIRNVSYENSEARSILRKADGLIDCILCIIFQSGNREDDTDFEDTTQMALIDNKIVENCVCILRNLTYAIQEITDPNYFEKRKNPNKKVYKKGNSNEIVMIAPPPSTGAPTGVELLWNSKYIVTALFPILKNGANAVTLEAAAGVIQNLTAGDWVPSKEMQIQFRYQLALPTLIELIDFGTNEIIRSASTALRNLVQEDFCRMLVGKYGLKRLSDRIPLSRHSKNIDSIALAAVLSTIYVIIFDQVEFMKDFLSNKGANRCLYIRDNDEYIMHNDSFPDKVKVFSQCILDLLWKTSTIQELMKKDNIKQSDISYPNNQPRSFGRSSNQDERITNNVKLHESMVTEQEFETSQYPRDERYLRDSMADVVSNKDLQERNSVAYTSNFIPGYGNVRLPASHKVSNKQNRVSDASSENSHNSINNTFVYDHKIQTRIASPSSPPIPNVINLNNKRDSKSSSHYVKTSRDSQDLRNGNIPLTQQSKKRGSMNSNNSQLYYVYSKVQKARPLQSRENGHSAV